jgi:hypothetical protein
VRPTCRLQGVAISEPGGGVIVDQGEFDQPTNEGGAPRPADRVWLFRLLGIGVALLVFFLLGGAQISRDARVVGPGAVNIIETARGRFALTIVGVILITFYTVIVGPWAPGLVIRQPGRVPGGTPRLSASGRPGRGNA